MAKGIRYTVAIRNPTRGKIKAVAAAITKDAAAKGQKVVVVTTRRGR